MKKIGDWWTAVAALVWLLASTLLNSLIGSWMLSSVWRWFLSAQYGDGPSFGGWFGIASLVRLATLSRDVDKPRPDDEDDALGTIVLGTVKYWIGGLVGVGALWLIGTFFGWVR